MALAWSIRRRLTFAAATCTALGELHRRGLFRTVLTPADVLIDENLNPIVRDRDPSAVSESVTTDAATMRLRFTAPELIHDAATPDARSDVFAVGRFVAFLVLYEIPTRDVTARLTAVSPEIAGIVARATATDPKDRFASLDEIREALEECARYSARVDRSHTPYRVLSSPPPPAPQSALEEAVASFTAMPPVRVVLPLLVVALTLALLAVALIAVHPARPEMRLVARLVSVAGAALLGASMLRGRALRLASAVLVAGVVALTDPTTMLARGLLVHATKSGTVEASADAARALVAMGETEFPGIVLENAQLAHSTFMGANLDGADLRRASLMGADMATASLRRAQLEGAHAEGTDFTGAQFEGSHGLETVTCDGATVLPGDYECKQRHIQRREDNR